MSTPGEKTTETIPFIDAHHHLWDFDRFTPSWLAPGAEDDNPQIEDYDPIRRPYLVEDLLADFEGSNVVKSIHVQTGYADVDPVEETAWLQSLADETGFPHGIVAAADLTSDSVEQDLEAHAAYSRMRGVRTFVAGDALLDADFGRGLRALQHLDLVYDLSTTWEGMAGARRMAEQHQDLQIVLGHAGLPLQRDPEYVTRWRDAIRDLAGAPNVAVKISGLGLGDNHWTESSIRPFVFDVIDAFGVERAMLGTNWPVDKLFSSYRTLVEAYRSIVSDLSFGEQQSLLWRNSQRYYRLD